MDRREMCVTISKVVDRAEKLGLLSFGRISSIMDMEHATKEFNLDLQAMLNADDFNFTHDFVGIANHIDRNTGKFDLTFVPRFAKEK
jgi:hypothetical protein